MARFDQPKKYRIMVLVKTIRDGKEKFIREPYDIVRYNWGDGTVQTGIEPTCGRALSPLESEELYDEVKTFDAPGPYAKTKIGSAT